MTAWAVAAFIQLHMPLQYHHYSIRSGNIDTQQNALCYFVAQQRLEPLFRVNHGDGDLQTSSMHTMLESRIRLIPVSYNADIGTFRSTWGTSWSQTNTAAAAGVSAWLLDYLQLGAAVMVEDTSLCFNAYKGLPGAAHITRRSNCS
jgi:hypothetical protein